MTSTDAEARCTLPGCDGPLHIVWRYSRPVFLDDLTCDGDLPAADDAYVGSWRVECEHGHVILLPGAEGLRCPCGDDACNGAEAGAGHDDFDEENVRTFLPVDAARLRSQVAAVAGAR